MSQCEPFHPGAEWGFAYDTFIWVCVNPVTRTFDQCDLKEGAAVWQRFKEQVQRRGLAKTTFVFNSGCMLGCKPHGTTIAISSKKQLNAKGEKQLFYQNVTGDDVERILNDITHNLKTDP